MAIPNVPPAMHLSIRQYTDTPAYDAVLLNQVWLQTDQQFKDTTEIVIF